MKKSVKIEEVQEVMAQSNIDDEKIIEVVSMLKEKLGEDADTEAEPKAKKQYCILVSDPEGVIPKDKLVGWSLQIPEGDSPLECVDRLKSAGYDYNATKKGRKSPVETIGEIIEVVSDKHTKAHSIWRKTREPVLILTTDNILPKE